MVASCGCGVAKPLPKKIKREQLEHLTKHTRLKPAEVKALYARFRRLAPSGYLDQEQFRQTMGVLGLTDDHFLPNRMFSVFDEDQDGKLSFYEFASSLATMIRGTEDEKLRLSFEMTAGHRGAQGIASEDFQRLVTACNTMMSSLVTPSRLATAEDADRLFSQLATKNEDGVEIITLDAYKDAAHNDNEFLAALGLELPRERIAGKSRVPSHGHLFRSEERRTTRNITSERAALEQAAAAAQAQMAAQTSATVSESQLEELRGRVDALRRSAVERLEQRRRNRERQQARAEEFKPVPVQNAASKQEEKPRTLFGGWWSALECCHAERPEQPLDLFEDCDPASPTHISEASEEGTAVLEEVVSELDGILTSIPRVSRERGEAEGEGASASHGPPEANNSDSNLTTPNNRARMRISFALGGGSAGTGPSLADGADPGTTGSTSERDARQAPAPLVDCVPVATQSSSREGSLELSSDVPDTGRQTNPNAQSGDQDGPIMDRATSSASLGVRHREEPKNNRKRQRRHRLLGPKKGLAVHFGHENWNMVLSMMIGIRMSVGRVRHEIARELQPVDFIMKEKFSIIPRLANIFDSAVSRRVAVTRFVDYAPLVFQRIRAGFGIQHEEYLKSVGPEQLLGNMILGNLSSLSELSSEGKSGAFFYYTADGKFMMKTVTAKEHSLLKMMLPGYYDHIQNNPDTLLCRFLGLHSLRIQKRPKAAGRSYRQTTRKLYFLVMGNMFNTPFEIHQRYDLKGSWVGRVTAPEDMQPGVALKDVDFTKASEAIRVGPERRKELVEQIERDSVFLRDHNIIDYSLLLGICDLGADGLDGLEDRQWSTGSPRNLLEDAELDPNNASRLQSVRTGADGCVPVHQRDMGGLLSSDRKSLYFFGIIDILTCYDNAKKMETMLKALYYDPKGVSCCPPAQYSERFTTFMKRAFV